MRIPNDRQIEIMRHATAWPKKYRNHFVTYSESVDFGDCEALREMSLMKRNKYHLDEMGESYIYHVSPEGMAVLNSLNAATGKEK